MLVAFARNQTIVAMKGNGVSAFHTDPTALGESNYCQATLHVAALFSQNAATPTLQVEAYGSNDGTNWFAITTIAFSVTAAGGPHEDGDYVTCAFLRFQVELNSDAVDGDTIAGATFDLHANLTRK